MYELKTKLERYLRVNLLGPGPRLVKQEFTGPRSQNSWETLLKACTLKQTTTFFNVGKTGKIVPVNAVK